ncbi:hypothetical protein PUNSTDRAFT_140295 [Punctularia strigosozonata HHB-11173 SS5]|uniref:uncharacterized protein n=1 Tax=Punctularia strigosozonata (strain HHB-11173) TaxID=741275 RepID=UPI00044183A5|nr:uncharacterized protein PUNSTDRAFT_140295 [Punctularia strigosozonata HHB-11173 SS5]EIN13852.1 hypothetical protein PUNSTDRAFT_140295 [Punctularia strigosozonata HHB-11173 SS5]
MDAFLTTLKQLGQFAGQMLLGGMLASGGFLLSLFAPVLIRFVPTLGEKPAERRLAKRLDASKKIAGLESLESVHSEKTRTSVVTNVTYVPLRTESPDSSAPSHEADKHVTFTIQPPTHYVPVSGNLKGSKSSFPKFQRKPRPSALPLPLPPAFEISLPTTAPAAHLPTPSSGSLFDKVKMRTPSEKSRSPQVSPRPSLKELCTKKSKRAKVFRSATAPVPKIKKRPSSSPRDQQASTSYAEDCYFHHGLKRQASGLMTPLPSDSEIADSRVPCPITKRKSSSPKPTPRTQPYAAPYFFPSPGSPEATDYVRRVREERRQYPRRAASIDVTLPRTEPASSTPPVLAASPSLTPPVQPPVTPPSEKAPPGMARTRSLPRKGSALRRFSWGPTDDLGVLEITKASPPPAKEKEAMGARSPSRPLFKLLGKSSPHGQG